MRSNNVQKQVVRMSLTTKYIVLYIAFFIFEGYTEDIIKAKNIDS